MKRSTWILKYIFVLSIAGLIVSSIVVYLENNAKVKTLITETKGCVTETSDCKPSLCEPSDNFKHKTLEKGPKASGPPAFFIEEEPIIEVPEK